MLASAWLVTRMALASHSRMRLVRRASAPSNAISVISQPNAMGQTVRESVLLDLLVGDITYQKPDLPKFTDEQKTENELEEVRNRMTELPFETAGIVRTPWMGLAVPAEENLVSFGGLQAHQKRLLRSGRDSHCKERQMVRLAVDDVIIYIPGNGNILPFIRCRFITSELQVVFLRLA